MINEKNLTQMDNERLRMKYKELFSKKPPPKSSREFLLGNISWAVQLKDIGKNHHTIRKRLLSQSSNQTISSKKQYLSGT